MTYYGQPSPYSQPPSPFRGRLALIGGALAIFLAAAGAAVLILTRPPQDEELAAEESPQALLTSPTASLGPTLEVTPSTPTPAPTWTPEPPYEHVVSENETLFFILQLYGYRTLEVVPAVLALNGLPSEDYIQTGQTLLIPRQTPTPSPSPDPNQPTAPPPAEEASPEPGVAEAETPELPAGATSPPESIQGGDPTNRVNSPDGRFWVHTVREGETIASIARAYDSSVTCIQQNNSFTYSGQNPVIFTGQQINVCIVVTLTPTPSPTGDPFNSTATPTPTASPPLLLEPAAGASVGRNQDVVLRWVATHALNGDQRYLVIAQDLTNNRDFRATTTQNAFKLPGDLRPGAGQTFTFEWRVVVVQGATAESPMVSGLGEPRQFTWGG